MINRSFPGYHWIYWVGPGLGSLLASGFYGLLVLVQWQKINPGQDFNEWEANAKPVPGVRSDNTEMNNGSYSHGAEPRRDVAPGDNV